MTATVQPEGRPVDTRHSPRAVWRTLGLQGAVIEGGLWAKRQAANRDMALPHGFRMLEAAGNLQNLRIAAGRAKGTYRGPVFMDSDVYKWLEAAAYEVGRAPCTSLAAAMDTTIDLVPAVGRPADDRGVPHDCGGVRGAIRCRTTRIALSSGGSADRF